MMRSGRKTNTEPVPWFCSSCTAHNSAEADRCSNLKCNLLRKVSGVDLVPGSERPFAVPIVSCEKQKRCGECDGCKAPECGLCGMCLDMPKRGGKGTKKQPCELRVCVRVRKGAEERLEERAEENEADRRRRELERAKREADRLARIEAMAEERRQKHESKQAKEKDAKEQELSEEEAKQELTDDISPAPCVVRISFTQAAKELRDDIKRLLALSKAGGLTVAASGAAMEIIDRIVCALREDEATHLVMGGDGYALRVLTAMASGNCEMVTHEWASA